MHQALTGLEAKTLTRPGECAARVGDDRLAGLACPRELLDEDVRVDVELLTERRPADGVPRSPVVDPFAPGIDRELRRHFREELLAERASVGVDERVDLHAERR